MTQEQLRHLGAWGRDARNERRAPSRELWGLAAVDPSHPHPPPSWENNEVVFESSLSAMDVR